ncbi:MAG: TonB-dependent hemoglobin/transferrin/lactoferrin family receptor [Candidatus Omnitrophica bacterium]|nr:TonB-dependent hemoglobin/transferrin/lactoferrin family receptor [Candidatus Omnitrophota bacterium]
MRIFTRVFIILSACAWGVGSFRPAAAEETQVKKSRSNLDTVVVIGTKTEKDILSSPQSVSVVTSEAIEKGMARDIGDILREVPGVEIDGGPRAIGEDINIRGLSGARVQIRQDGARMDFLSGHLGRLFSDVDAIESIEILKGSASSLYGSDAIGGVINIRTKEPGDLLAEGEKFGMRTRFNYSSVNQDYREAVSVFGIPNGPFEYLFNFSHWDSDKGMDLSDNTQLTNSGQQGAEGLAKLIYHPTDSSDLVFSYNKFDENSTVPGNPATALSSSNLLRDRITERELFNLGFVNKAEGSWLEDFQANAYYHLTEIRQDKRTGAAQLDHNDLDTLGIELKNSNKFDLVQIPNQLTYGIEYYKDNGRGNRLTSSGGASIGSFPDGSFTGWAPFIQDEISFFDDRLDVIPGLRWDNFESESSGNPTNKDNRVSPKIGLVYQWREWLNPFFNYGLGFRAPRLTELYPSGTHFPGNTFVANPNLIPEKSENLEAGARGKWNRFSYEAAYYLIHAEDFIETVVGTTTTTSRNLNQVELWGLEGSLNFDLGAGFSTFTSLEIRRGKNTETDEFLTSIAPDEIGTGLKYENPEKTFYASFSGRLVGTQERPPLSANHTSGYNVWDLKTAVKIPWIKETKLSFGVENIFDKSYREHLASLRAPARNFIVGLSKEFKW